jgi:EpsI family protein
LETPVIARTTILAGVLAAWCLVTNRATAVEPVRRAAPLAAFPVTVGPWVERSSTQLAPEVLAILGADDYLNRTYASADGAAVGLYVGYYKSQRQGDTIHSPLNCLPGAGWQIVEHDRMRIALASPTGGLGLDDGPRGTDVNSLAIVKGRERQVVIYWYQHRSRVVAGEYAQRIRTVIDAFTTGQTDAALVRIIVPVSGEAIDGGATAEAIASSFAEVVYPVLSRWLPR